jgi:hypothetical protein
MTHKRFYKFDKIAHPVSQKPFRSSLVTLHHEIDGIAMLIYRYKKWNAMVSKRVLKV